LNGEMALLPSGLADPRPQLSQSDRADLLRHRHGWADPGAEVDLSDC